MGLSVLGFKLSSIETYLMELYNYTETQSIAFVADGDGNLIATNLLGVALDTVRRGAAQGCFAGEPLSEPV